MAKLLRAAKMEKCIGCGSCTLACARIRERSVSLERGAIRIRTAGGFRSSMLADICLGCSEPACAAACPSSALTKRAGGGVILRKDRCIGCERCEQACAVKGIRYRPDLGYPVVCIHCGACVPFCPHGCLEMEETHGA